MVYEYICKFVEFCSRCDEKSSCFAFANATHFPNDMDPCPSTVKYLEAQFYCMKVKVTQQPTPSSEVTKTGTVLN